MNSKIHTSSHSFQLKGRLLPLFVCFALAFIFLGKTFSLAHRLLARIAILLCYFLIWMEAYQRDVETGNDVEQLSVNELRAALIKSQKEIAELKWKLDWNISKLRACISRSLATITIGGILIIFSLKSDKIFKSILTTGILDRNWNKKFESIHVNREVVSCILVATTILAILSTLSNLIRRMKCTEKKSSLMLFVMKRFDIISLMLLVILVVLLKSFAFLGVFVGFSGCLIYANVLTDDYVNGVDEYFSPKAS